MQHGWLNPNGWIYLFTSGPGAFLLSLSSLGVFVGLWRHLNCHSPGCWRPARHAMGGYCRKHHQN